MQKMDLNPYQNFDKDSDYIFYGFLTKTIPNQAKNGPKPLLEL